MNARSAFLFFFGLITFMNLSSVYTAGAPAGRTADDDKIAQIFDVFTWIQRQHHTKPFAALYKILRAQYSSEPFTSATRAC